MRTNIPSFRLPEEVLDEEVYRVIKMGAKFVNNTEIKSMKSLVDDEKFDAIFVGTGAPKGKNLNIPGRDEASENIHIGIDWLTLVLLLNTYLPLEKKLLLLVVEILQWIAVEQPLG